MSGLQIWVIFLVWLLISSFLMVFVRGLLGGRITFTTKHGDIIYSAISGLLAAMLGYLVLSAIAGHFLQ